MAAHERKETYFLVYLFFIWLSSTIVSAQKKDRKLVSIPLHVHIDDGMFFEVTQPDSIRYTYKVRPAKNFGGVFNQSLINVNLVPTKPDHACSPLESSFLIQDNVALIDRGGCSFLTKASNAQDAGAIAAIVTDNKKDNDEYYIDMIDDGTKRDTYIPVVFLLGKDGYMIRKALEEEGLMSAVINIPVNITGVPVNKRNQPPWTLW